MDRQNTNEGSTMDNPRHAGDTVKPADATGEHRPTEEERRAGEGGVAERGAEAAQVAGRKQRKAPAPASWQGQAVADAPDGQAEADADVAAGRVPGHHRGEARAPSESRPPVRMTPDEERANQELKREAAAEDHEADRAEGRGTAPKNL